MQNVSGFLRGILECPENFPIFGWWYNFDNFDNASPRPVWGSKRNSSDDLNRSRATCDQCDAMCPFVLLPDPRRYILKCDLMTVDSWRVAPVDILWQLWTTNCRGSYEWYTFQHAVDMGLVPQQWSPSVTWTTFWFGTYVSFWVLM